ncbi:MAG TPA: ubiquinol-cytochrome c reductase cytochrome b subunit [Acidimicrobiales bacterium]|nr:ubiquinol-cytochrome c reductase cytochrome b subunit [Acidimicrobiales bacterium]
MIDGLFGWVDNRLAISRGGRHLLNKIFPDHWSFMIGEIALYSFIVLVATGVFLTLYFIPSGHDVIYQGSYVPLVGEKVSEAYKSTIDLSFQVRTGLLMRQMHHWSANIFVGSIVVHMLRVFFTGAFRRPREINWIVGSTLLILAILNGFLGYSLPDDLISGTGIRIAFSILESVPLAGSYLAFFLFGGNYPGNGIIIPRFFILHVLIIPLIIFALLGAHLGMLVRHKHTQFRGRGAREDNVVGTPMWPGFIAKTTGFLFLIAGVTALLGAFVQINPIWLYGPYVVSHVSYAVQPDWYMGWLDGALRVMPSWEIHFPGHMIPNAFFPAVLLPGITFNAIFAWPWIEAKLTGDTAEHHLLDRPRDRPVRTGFGAAVFAFYFVLFGASATDVLANYLDISLNFVLAAFRVLCIIVPLVTFPVAYKVCKELQGTPGAWKRKRHNVVIRRPDGGYEAIPVEDYVEYAEPELDPIDVDRVALMPPNGDAPAPDGVYEIPRSYR